MQIQEKDSHLYPGAWLKFGQQSGRVLIGRCRCKYLDLETVIMSDDEGLQDII